MKVTLRREQLEISLGYVRCASSYSMINQYEWKELPSVIVIDIDPSQISYEQGENRTNKITETKEKRFTIRKMNEKPLVIFGKSDSVILNGDEIILEEVEEK